MSHNKRKPNRGGIPDADIPTKGHSLKVGKSKASRSTETKDRDELLQLLQQGTDWARVNSIAKITDVNHLTKLCAAHWAAYHGNLEMTEYFISRGVQPIDLSDKLSIVNHIVRTLKECSDTSICFAIDQHGKEDRFPAQNCIGCFDKLPPFCDTVSQTRIYRNILGRTWIHEKVCRGQPVSLKDFIKYFCMSGYDVYWKDIFGDSIFYSAAKLSNLDKDTQKYLLEIGIEVCKQYEFLCAMDFAESARDKSKFCELVHKFLQENQRQEIKNILVTWFSKLVDKRWCLETCADPLLSHLVKVDQWFECNGEQNHVDELSCAKIPFHGLLHLAFEYCTAEHISTFLDTILEVGRNENLDSKKHGTKYQRILQSHADERQELIKETLESFSEMRTEKPLEILKTLFQLGNDGDWFGWPFYVIFYFIVLNHNWDDYEYQEYLNVMKDCELSYELFTSDGRLDSPKHFAVAFDPRLRPDTKELIFAGEFSVDNRRDLLGAKDKKAIRILAFALDNRDLNKPVIKVLLDHKLPEKPENAEK